MTEVFLNSTQLWVTFFASPKILGTPPPAPRTSVSSARCSFINPPTSRARPFRLLTPTPPSRALGAARSFPAESQSPYPVFGNMTSVDLNQWSQERQGADSEKRTTSPCLVPPQTPPPSLRPLACGERALEKAGGC